MSPTELRSLKRQPAAAPAPAGADPSANRLRASLIDLTFAIWALALCFALSYRVLNADGDLARHIVMGGHILDSGVRVTDVFSHTRAGQPFLAYEWGSQVVFHLVHAAGGLAGVLVFGALVIAGVYALVVRFMLRRGVDPLLAYAAGIAAALLGSAHWSARPHLFTLVAGIALLELITRRGDGEAKRRAAPMLAGIAVLFVFWANMHPGFVLGLAVLAAAAVGAHAEARGLRARRRGDAERAWLLTAAFGVALLATLVTPHGVGLHLHIIGHLRSDYLMSVTDEFRPLNFFTTYGAVFVIVMVASAAGLIAGRRRPPLDRAAIVLLLLAGALVARRNIPLFGLIAVPLLALELDGVWRGLGSARLANVRKVFRDGEALAAPGRYAPWLAAALIALGLAHGRVAGVKLLPDSFDARTFPVAAVAEARAAGLDGRIFNHFIWGGYLLYAWPEQRIYIDGMTDFFGEELTRSYMRVQGLESGWQRELDDRAISIVIVPPAAPLNAALLERGWRTWYADGTAVILTRGDAAGGVDLPIPDATAQESQS